MKKQTNYRPSNTIINNVCASVDSQATASGKLIGQFRTLVDKGANASDTLSRIMRRLHTIYPNDASLGNSTDLGIRWGYAVEAYRQAYAETGQTLQRVSNAKLKGYVADYKAAKVSAKVAPTPVPKNNKGETPQQANKRQAVVLHDVMPFATGLSTGKLKAALSDTDAVSAILLAARIIEAATGQHAAFSAVLNSYTEQKRSGSKRTLKAA